MVCLFSISGELQRLAGNSGDHLIQPPCSKLGQLKQLAQDCGQLGSEHLQGWLKRVCNFSTQPIECAVTLTAKTFISYVAVQSADILW